jgi:branched-chain amino acid transport system substrate-binding protein
MEANPDVVFAIPSPADGVTFVRQSKELGLKVKLLFLERASAATQLWELLGKDTEGLINVQNWCWNLPTPGNKELVERYRKEKNVLPSSVLGPAYAAVQVLAKAIENAGTLDREKVRDALTKIHVDTVIGPVSFLPDGRIAAVMNVLQWQNGSQVIVYPPEYASGKFIYPMP